MIERLRQWLLKWLELDKIETRVATAHTELSASISKEVSEAKAQIGLRVREEISKIRSSPQRYVACPTCGKGFDMSGHDLHVHFISVLCDNCKHAFEVRPSLFWEKIEVSRRA